MPHGKLLAPFRTWRNTNTGRAADELTRLFGFNIPLRWSIAHLHQAVLDSEEHAPRVAHLTTLAGWVHHQLTGRHVLGIGDASGMFPIDSTTGTYVASYLDQYEALVENRVPWRLRDVLPTVLSAGEDAGALTPEGVALIDPTGILQPGIALCPPEGDAGTGMIATNAIAQCTGNISCGTSVFLMAVIERSLAELHTEIDMVTTPDGSPVAMVHSNNGASELDAWVGWFADFARLIGADVSVPAIYDTLYNHALTGEADAGGVMAYNTLSAEPIVGQEAAQPVFTHTADARVTLANAVRAQLMSIFAAVRIGVDILREEGVAPRFALRARRPFQDAGRRPADPRRLAEHPCVRRRHRRRGRRVGHRRARALPRCPGWEFGDSCPAGLPLRAVFAEASVSTLEPTPEGVAGYERFLDAYRASLPGVEVIARGH